MSLLNELGFFRLTSWWSRWWLAPLTTSVASSRTRPRNPGTGSRSELNTRWVRISRP